MRRSDPPRNIFLNPNPSGKYSRLTAKNAVSEPKVAISITARVGLATNILNEVKLPINENTVTSTRRNKRILELVLSRFNAGNQVKNRAIGPLKSVTARIIVTKITSYSIVKG